MVGWLTGSLRECNLIIVSLYFSDPSTERPFLEFNDFSWDLYPVHLSSLILVQRAINAQRDPNKWRRSLGVSVFNHKPDSKAQSFTSM